MAQSKVDLPSLFMVLAFTSNLIICYFDPFEILGLKEIGIALLVTGGLFFVYVLLYLRSGFFGETEPKLHFLITTGPYRFCRHPQYLSFIIMILGFDLMFRSVVGVVFTFTLSILSTIFRARVEDRLLRKKFGKEWENYADKVGFLFPKLKSKHINSR
jgi:protein-S-isoprenylcysteine O-methyltransferase Ste14